ncbi:MAG: ABC transporter permease [Actinobacteria bacterium]|nr:ABC transporter permease [Actinomycetota bacterium]
MTFSLKRVYAIFEKDIKDLSKNMFVLTTVIMPLLLAILFGRAKEPSIEIHYLVINLAFTAVAAFVQCALIAEEKEKNTLRGLILSPASTFEILSGKSLLSIVLTVITVTISAILTGYEPANFLIVGLAILVSIFFYIALGTLLGLLTKSVMEASLIILPIIFLFGFGTVLKALMAEYPQLSFVKYLPNIQLELLATEVQNGAGITDIWAQLAVIAVWVVSACALVVVTYKKRAIDE